MLDEYFKRRDVSHFLHKIKEEEDYYQKNSQNYFLPSFVASNELALYIFYDALLKYKIILEEDSFFTEFMEQIDKLYKKMDDFEKIEIGVNQLICRMVCEKYNYRDLTDDVTKKELLSFIYEKYVEEGYYIHGFSPVYKESILKDGFVPEEYFNYYDDFSKVSNIFSKYHVGEVIHKDFYRKKVSFTDSVVLGCYYSSYSPMYFYELLCNEKVYGKKIMKDAYIKKDFSSVFRPLKRFMNNAMFSEVDRKFITQLAEREWNFLHAEDLSVALLLVKRKKWKSSNRKLEDYLNDSRDVYEIVDRMLNSKNNHISLEEKLEVEDFTILTLPNYYERQVTEREEDTLLEEEIQQDFLDKYGNASFFLILGSLLISLGVFITIIMLIRGIKI